MSQVAPSIESPPPDWEIVPRGFFGRHYDLRQQGRIVTFLEMHLFREACQFAIGGHEFEIRRESMWKDVFQLTAAGEPLCDAKRAFWARRFELITAGDSWALLPAGWLTRSYLVQKAGRDVGEIRPAGWFTRRWRAEFGCEVPPPIQVLAIFLVLVVNRRSQHTAASQ